MALHVERVFFWSQQLLDHVAWRFGVLIADPVESVVEARHMAQVIEIPNAFSPLYPTTTQTRPLPGVLEHRSQECGMLLEIVLSINRRRNQCTDRVSRRPPSLECRGP